MNFDAKKYWKERSKPCPYQDDKKICYTGEGTACKGCKWNKKENDNRVNAKGVRAWIHFTR